MNRAAEIKRAVAAGRKRGAVLGTVIFLVAGIGPGISLGSYAAMILLAHLTGGPLEPGWIANSALLAGAVVGAVSAGAISITACMICGAILASSAEILKGLVRTYGEDQERRRKSVTVLRHGPMPEGLESDIRSRLSFLREHGGSIHSIVLVGSTAHGGRDSGSDYDIVLICNKKGFAEVQSAVCEREIAEALNGSVRMLEFTLLHLDQVRHLFELASPFAYALRHGVVLEDDGCLRTIMAKRYLPSPGRKYCLRALYEGILVPYYGSFRTLEMNARKKGCTADCCQDRSACRGLLSADVPATVIMRMLYVTLPLHGCMPLAKTDVLFFTKQVYGLKNTEVLGRTMVSGKNASDAIYYTEYRELKPFARMLFREILGVVDGTKAVRRMLADAASVVQGRYGRVRDPQLRECVLQKPA